MIPIITGFGGLLVGLITTKFSPESEGHGTDAVIEAYHNKGGNIRGRVPLVKGIASAITLGSGGSGGTEGPAGQIAAGFGSLIGKLFHLDEDERELNSLQVLAPVLEIYSKCLWEGLYLAPKCFTEEILKSVSNTRIGCICNWVYNIWFYLWMG